MYDHISQFSLKKNFWSINFNKKILKWFTNFFSFSWLSLPWAASRPSCLTSRPRRPSQGGQLQCSLQGIVQELDFSLRIWGRVNNASQNFHFFFVGFMKRLRKSMVVFVIVYYSLIVSKIYDSLKKCFTFFLN